MRPPLRVLLAALGLASTLARPAPIAAAPAASPAAAPSTAPLDRVLDDAIAAERIVGAVVVVMQDGRIVYHRAAGLADREARRPMTERALFRLASVSKTLVSAAALALVQQGKLDLDDPVRRHLPDFRPKLPDGREPVITVRQLLTHTAGLSYGFFEPPGGPYERAGVSDGLDAADISLAENLRRIATVPLSYEPGARWAYSVAIDVLGAVVARAGGGELPEVVARLVTRPLGLADTGFRVTDAARLATPYADGKPRPVRMGATFLLPLGPGRVRYEPGRALSARAFPSGGAGMIGSAGELASILEALRTGRLLPAAVVQQMMSPQVGAAAQTQGPGWGFGFGGAVLVDPQAARTPQSAGTFQWGGAYGHSWFVDPQKKLTVVALTNTALEGMNGAFTTALRDAVYGVFGGATASATSGTPATPGIRLYTLDCGHLDIKDLGMFSDTGRHAGEPAEMTVPCFLVRHPKGDLLWDLGVGDRLAALPAGEPNPAGRSRLRVTLLSQLAQLALTPSDIEYVALSHLHADHAGNAALFPGATWLTNPDELKWALGQPTPLGVDGRHARSVAQVARTVTVRGDHDVFGDGSVRILATPGHTPGHQSLLVRLAKTGPVILSGDLFHTRENFEQTLVPPFNHSRADTLASAGRIRRLMTEQKARLVVEHEPKDVRALPVPPRYLE